MLEKLTSKIMGLDIKQVDDYFDGLEKDNTIEIMALESQIKDAKDNKNKLQQELIQLKKDMENNVKSKELFKLAKERAIKLKDAMRTLAEEEMAEINKNSKQKAIFNDSKVSRIESEIKATRNSVYTLLNNITDMVEEGTKDKEAEYYASGRVAGKILPSKMSILSAIDKKLDQLSKEPVLREESDPKSQNEAKSQYEMEFQHEAKSQVELKSQDRVYEIEKPMTADGAVAPDFMNTIIKNKAREVSFWDEPENEGDQTETYINETAATKLKNSLSENSANETRRENFFNSYKEDTAKITGTETKPEHIETKPMSPAINHEINQIRHKYVAGKVAGENLIDRNGDIIIEKGKIITQEIIEKAEIEGKLAELIVNMVLPGLEE